MINDKGGIHEWAKAQPQYKMLKDKKLKNKKKHRSKKQFTNTLNDDLSLSIKALEKRINKNKELINRANKQIEQDKALIKYLNYKNK